MDRIQAARLLVLAGASIFGVLGALHLIYTFFSDKFLPRDAAVMQGMKATSPVLTRQMTMWDAWVSFNATHSLGAILLSAFYLLLASLHMDLLVSSKVFLALAVLAGLSYVCIGYAYWFRTPFIGATIATSCFALATILVFTKG